MKFDYVIGNPPYQQETAELKENYTNAQTPKKNVFHLLQIEADKVTSKSTVMIYPAGRWIQQSGKGLQEFGHNQINDQHLKRIDVYQDSSEIFNSVAISDGVSIVIKDKTKNSDEFDYYYHNHGITNKVTLKHPGNKIMPLNPLNSIVVDKLNIFMQQYNLDCMNIHILPRTLFGIESSFVEENPDKVRLFNSDDDINFDSEVKLFTNDKAGKKGRAKWFVSSKDNIVKNKDLIDKWKVVVSSANAGGQKRDRQLEIIDNHSVFGRSRVALKLFNTEEEAMNFYNYVESYIIKFAFLMTDEALTTLGKAVPDLLDYSDSNSLIDFSHNIDTQLQNLMNIDDETMNFIIETVRKVRKK